jgi:hypothetical protein
MDYEEDGEESGGAWHDDAPWAEDDDEEDALSHAPAVTEPFDITVEQMNADLERETLTLPTPIRGDESLKAGSGMIPFPPISPTATAARPADAAPATKVTVTPPSGGASSSGASARHHRQRRQNAAATAAPAPSAAPPPAAPAAAVRTASSGGAADDDAQLLVFADDSNCFIEGARLDERLRLDRS